MEPSPIGPIVASFSSGDCSVKRAEGILKAPTVCSDAPLPSIRRPRALKVLRELERRGLPNYFGRQRFGAKNDNHFVGRSLLLGQLKRRMPTQKRKLMLNAMQSAIFNEVLAERVRAGTMDACHFSVAVEPQSAQRAWQLRVNGAIELIGR